MTDPDVAPPTEWFEADTCSVDGCEEERFTPIGMDLHLVRDHDTRTETRSVAEQIDSGVSR